MQTAKPDAAVRPASWAWLLLLFVSATWNSLSAQLPKLNSYPQSKATVYLDFDGHDVQGTAWNWEGSIKAKHCELPEPAIRDIFNSVAEDFRIFNINITTDQDVYSKAPANKRMRIIVTPTYQWYGHAGGVAFVNSFTWGDDTPAWVFTSLLDNNSKFIAEAVSHEIGHTLGLQHQSEYGRTCGLMNEYAGGKGIGEIGWAPIMGVGYYKNFTTWTYGTSIEGCKVMQNDIGIISKGLNELGLRNDDHGNTRATASKIVIDNENFVSSGIINHAPDKDIFKIQLLKKSRITASAIPANNGADNAGANIDMLMTLMKNSGDTILRSNPKMRLSASIDTLLPAGTYYIGVDGMNNQNVSDYGSVGLYTLAGTVLASSTSVPVIMTGVSKQRLHILSWKLQAPESITRTYLEYSYNGDYFVPLGLNPITADNYTNEPAISGRVYYRLRMVLPDESSYYSDAVVLTTGSVSVNSTMVNSHVQVNSPGDYSYQIFDEIGRLYQKGKLLQGFNTISIADARKGLLVMKVFNNSEQLTFKLIKQ